MIDRQTGQLALAPKVRICAGDSLEAVASLSLGDSNVTHDMHTGWIWLFARSVQVQTHYYGLHFGFCHNKLKMISLVVSQEPFEPIGSWDTWSEGREIQRLKVYKQWLLKELGREGRFSWGTVTADYDQKSASSSITINFDN
jgi:hypothetical protein